MNNLIIFSKNRACQLDLLIRSIYKNSNIFNNIYILYCYDKLYENGYEKLKNKYKNINFILEKKFKTDLLNLLDTNYELTTFMVDDMIIYRDINDININNIYNEIDDDTICFSLRLGLNCNYSHPADTYYYPINFKSKHNILEFFYKEQVPGDFSYPLSTDGHIYKTHIIKNLLNNINFYNPNTMEIQLQKFKNNIPNKIKCFNNSATVSVPVNIVNNSVLNRNAITYRYDTLYLENMFNDDYVLDLDLIDFSNINGPHKELFYKFKKKI